MKCNNCSYINPDNSRFCSNCGKPLERTCPNCGSANSPQSKFCNNCGFNLSAPQPGPAEKTSPARPAGSDLDRFAAVVPAALMEKARSSSRVSGERRIVTVLFADVVGSTGLAEQMDPEDWAAIMNRAFDLLTPVIYHYEGTIARLMGDALLAFFGAPIAHEDDPIRAAHAAMDLIQVASSYSQELKDRSGIEFAIRVGMNTGPVVVGEVGSSLIYEYTAMGDAVNLAARMQTAASPMTALITENTYRFLSQAFECTDLGRIEIRGKLERVHVYELGQPRLHPARTRYPTGLASRLVGRDEEMAVLMRLSQAVQAGLGRAVLITGEPGIGKTRLIEEWKQRLLASTDPAGPGLRWVEGHCLSYGQGMAYHLMADLLRSILSVQISADSSETLAALDNLCRDLFPEESSSVFPYLAHLLSLPMDEEALQRLRLLDPQALQEKYLSSLRRLGITMASRQPLFIILEDLHWADPSSIHLLTRLLPLVLENRIGCCLLARPERESSGWKLVSELREQMGPGLTELPLRALTEDESSQLVSGLLETVNIPAPVFDLILGKSEGNPLFVEEVIRMLVDRHILVRQQDGWQMSGDIANVEIPDNLQSLLLARIDRLPEDARRTLRVAAVIGRQFSVRVLEEMLKRQSVQGG